MLRIIKDLYKAPNTMAGDNSCSINVGAINSFVRACCNPGVFNLGNCTSETAGGPLKIPDAPRPYPRPINYKSLRR